MSEDHRSQVASSGNHECLSKLHRNTFNICCDWVTQLSRLWWFIFIYVSSQVSRISLSFMLHDLCLFARSTFCQKSPWTQRHSFRDAPQLQTNDICLTSNPIHTTLSSFVSYALELPLSLCERPCNWRPTLPIALTSYFFLFPFHLFFFCPSFTVAL